jgi:hypothetical protein
MNNEVEESEEHILYCVEELDKLAQAFRTVGNQKLAKELFEMSDLLETSVHTIMEALGNETHARFLDAQQASVNVLSAVLAGIEVSKPKEN